MIALGIAAIALVGMTVLAMVWALSMPYAQASARLQQITAYGLEAPGVDAAGLPVPGPRRRHQRPSLLAALAGRFGGLLTRGRLQRYDEHVRAQLIAAAVYNVSSRTILGAQFLGAAVLGVLVLISDAGGSFGRTLMLAISAAAIAWLLPLIAVRGRARRRMDDIDRQVPDLIDMLVVTLEGGLGFGASLDAASTRMPEPVGDEIRLMMQEHRMGITTAEAMQNLLERVPTQNMQSFVRSVLQGETLGVSMGTIMRNLAEEMRVRRRQAAEERAQKAPVKMLFPLIFLMFPALGVVILGPALFSITDTLGSTGVTH